MGRSDGVGGGHGAAAWARCRSLAPGEGWAAGGPSTDSEGISDRGGADCVWSTLEGDDGLWEWEGGLGGGLSVVMAALACEESIAGGGRGGPAVGRAMHAGEEVDMALDEIATRGGHAPS